MLSLRHTSQSLTENSNNSTFVVCRLSRCLYEWTDRETRLSQRTMLLNDFRSKPEEVWCTSRDMRGAGEVVM